MIPPGTQMVKPKAEPQPNKSEQIGIVQVNGTITFIDEYVPSMNGYTEAWCLSFNQHLGRSLLLPADGGGGEWMEQLLTPPHRLLP
ncbi:hypothetical protein CRUP_023979, partial [Coryphaenoides rupestris]